MFRCGKGIRECCANPSAVTASHVLRSRVSIRGKSQRRTGSSMEHSSIWVLCAADSTSRLNYIARAIRKAGYNVILSTSAHHVVAIAAVGKNLDAVILDEDMVLGEGSVAESIKAVKPIPVLLVCDSGPSGAAPPGVDLVTANGSRQQILAGLVKLLAPPEMGLTSAKV